MCGIFFYYSKYKCAVPIFQNILSAATTIKSRGPEATNYIFNNNCIYCFHRLAINNVSHECNQPFEYKIENETSENETELIKYTVMCNGEIYNWKQICSEYNLTLEHQNDCGVIFPLFRHFNFNFDKLLNTLDGEFAIIITKTIVKKNDEETPDIWFGTDVCSVRPLFYTIDKINNIIVLSSLLSGIADCHHVSSVVHRVDGGKSYHIDAMNKELNNNDYSNIFTPSKHNYMELNTIKKPIDFFYQSVVETLTNAIHKRICSYNRSREIGCLLSGGLDSSLVASIAAKYLYNKGEKLKTFSIGMEGSTDLIYAKKVADYIGSEHTEVFFTPQEGIDSIIDVIKMTETYDITTIRASVGQYLLAKYIRKNTDIKIILNGDGADECQMGYLYFFNAPTDIDAQMDSVQLVKQIHYFDGLRVDRNISGHGLEARVPFLDKEFVDLLINKIPAKYKLPKNYNCEKYLIRKAFDPYNLLPTEVLWRRKEAFSDGVSSKEKSWFEILLDYFNEKDIPSKLYREHNPPYTKESCFYRLTFEKYFKERNDNVIPRFWLPNWTDEKDPSARKLKQIYDV